MVSNTDQYKSLALRGSYKEVSMTQPVHSALLGVAMKVIEGMAALERLSSLYC
jgi:hypothetical protein